jgi:hypothetical protein
LLSHHLPTWASELDAAYRDERSILKEAPPLLPAARGRASRPAKWLIGGPFTIEQVRFVYTFRHGRAPEEVIEVRQVRANAAADGYGLYLRQTDHGGFRVDEECIWGGDLVDAEYADAGSRTVYVRRVDFGRRLRRGERHEFAVRSWVERDEAPGTTVSASFSIPCSRVAFQVNFRGPERPQATYAFGPIADVDLATDVSTARTPIAMSRHGAVSRQFRNPEPGAEYGLGWEW